MEKHYMAISSHARGRVFERDKGICALCGCDTNFLKRMVWILRRRDDAEAMWLIKAAWGLERRPCGVWVVPNGWEADHTIPLVMGGTHDLSNYRTLCIKCHRQETAKLAKVRSRKHSQGLLI